ncbi:MAG TPA: succinate dehydrogenase cytochrome b subunit [Acidimicrobiia bacterium]
MTGAQLERKKRAPFFIEFYRSAVGKKWVMAVTGIILIGFVIAHMVGNLKIYLGPEPGGIYEIDEYAESLRTLLYPILPHHVFLWILRIAVLGAAVLHVHAAVALTVMNNRARSTGYQGPRQYLVANYASRTMRWSGFIVLAYVLFHLADFTWGIAPFAPDGWARGAVRANFIASFTRWPVVLLYVIANLLLGVHLYHGTWSMFQSLGINSPRFNAWRRWFAQAVAVLITAGNVSIPLAISFGLVA